VKRIAIGDIHLSAYKDDALSKDGLPERLSALIQACRKIFKFARTNSIQYVDILGDLYHDKVRQVIL